MYMQLVEDLEAAGVIFHLEETELWYKLPHTGERVQLENQIRVHRQMLAFHLFLRELLRLWPAEGVRPQ